MKKSLSLVVAVAVSGTAFGWQKKTAPLMTQWADDVAPENVLPEYPRPQMVRAEWMNLNGVWEFDCTRGITNRIPADEWKGCDRAVFDKVEFGRKLPREILVPFPVESALSGIVLVAMAVTLTIAAIISRNLYKKTGNIWTAACLNGILMTTMTIANTMVAFK